MKSLALAASAVAAILACGSAYGQTEAARAALLAERERLAAEAERLPAVLEPGPLLRPGDSGPAVAALRQALAALGWAATAADPYGEAVYDAALADTVRRFQAIHGLAADAVVGPDTRDAVNHSAERRIGRIDVALGLPDWPTEGRTVVVNIAAAEVNALVDGQPVLTSAAVVGRYAPDQRTPEVVTEIRSVTINPSWTVPPGIAARRFDGEQLTVPPGPENPLGRFRLDMPNSYLVYLHDTIEPELYAREQRTFSSGCVRVERIAELARWLIGDELWAAYDVDAVLTTRETVVVPLPEPVPVILEYRTASLGPDGSIRYHLDPYRYTTGRSDAQVAAAPPGEVWQVAP